MTDARVDIQQLLARYCHAVDRGSAHEVGALFAENAVLRPYYDAHYDVAGRAGIIRWYDWYHTHFRSSVRHLKHMIMSASIDVQGATASSVSYLLASALNDTTGAAFLVTGTYTDQLQKTDDGWQFADRLIEVEAMIPQSEAQETFPPLNFPRND